MKLICTFTTGRTATGYLSQVFGNGEYSKKALHKNAGAIVTHESWVDIKKYVILIKKFGFTKELKIKGREILLKKFKELETDTYFITDHRIGRYLLWACLDSDIDYRVLRVTRKPDSIIKSFDRRWSERRERVDEDVYNRFYDNVWAKSFYHPSDKDSILKSNNWNQLSDKDRIDWYIKETDAQWNSLQQLLDNDKVLSVEFEKLFQQETLKSISRFIEIPYSKKLYLKRANR